MSKVIVIAGPTASGKSSLGIKMALEKCGEIVSADSMQIYRGMDIGTAKVSIEEQSLVPHHMIDIVSPDEEFSVSRYVDMASACCEDILSRGLTPIIVGGTGLYIDSLLFNRSFEDNDPELRKQLNARYDEIGGEKMHEQLVSIDPERAAILSPNDKKRIVRAFEVYTLSGSTITEHDRLSKLVPPRYEFDFIFLNPDREQLYERINMRVDQMIEQGLVNEVETLLNTISPSTTSMQAIGYKEIVNYLNGEITLDEAVDEIKMSSRRYAKRQVTWFKRYEH